ncbi:MAG: ABC transporter ATP-binding protein [Rickettsiaceae bacterium]
MTNHISSLKSFEPNKSLSGLLKIYRHFIFHKPRKHVILLIVIAIVTGLIPAIDSLFLQNITDSIEAYSDQDIVNVDLVAVMFKWVFIYALWWEGLNTTWRLYDYLYLTAMPRIKAHVTDDFYNYVQYHSHEYFQTNLAGDITNRITEAARSIEMIFAYVNEKIVRKLSVLICSVVVLYSVHFIIALIFTGWLSIFICTSLYFSRKINSYSKAFSKDKATLAGKIVDSISNISIVRIFSSHKFERKYLHQYTENVVISDKKLQWFMFKLRYALGVSCTIMIGLMVYYILLLRNNLEISIGQCVLIITLCLSVIDDIWDLTQEFGDLFEQIGTFNQSISLLQDYSVKDAPSAKTLLVTSPSIEFKNATFHFRNNDNTFENQSIKILPYQKVGLTGFSGSGKTTFCSLIYRLYDLKQGTILIDGQDISKVSQSSLHNNISVIPQEPVLFHRSVKENISYGNLGASDEEIFAAAKAAHIHDLIMSLPEQYDTICGERGNNFSGGQRQRISIARAFLKKAPILILDEATSSLDSHTEQLVQQSLHKLMENKTVIVIAHRLSTLLHMDRILVFNKGHVIEDGTHEGLQKTGTLYKKLWNSY